MFFYMTNFYVDADGCRGNWKGWCTSEDSYFLFGLVIDAQDVWVRVFLNTGTIIWVLEDESCPI